MSGIYRWMTDVASKNWRSITGGQPAPTFSELPEDVFFNICEWLSVKDILALRMCNKSIARISHSPIIWLSLLWKLKVPLPVLPATSKYRFEEICPQKYEWLMVRALYLEQNWRKQNPISCHSRFEAFDRIIAMKMLPGGKYMVSVSKNSISQYSLLLWDLDHAGKRMALIGASSDTSFLKMEAKYGVIDNSPSIMVAYSKPPMQTEKGMATKVFVVTVPILLLEELVAHEPNSTLFKSFTNGMEFPFSVCHESLTYGDVAQLVLGDLEDEMVLVVVHRPRTLVFHYLRNGQQGNLILGRLTQYPTYRHSIWSVKLLANQRSILVSRLLLRQDNPIYDSVLFSLDVFQVPGPRDTYTNPNYLGRQFIDGLRIDEFSFSDLETTWFTSLRDPEGMFPVPANAEPPPISIFVTTKEPRGFVQFLMRPKRSNDIINLPDGRGRMRRFVYELPAQKAERNTWTDDYVRPMIIPGAYRSLISMRPQIHARLQEAGSAAVAEHGIEVMWFCTHATRGGNKRFSTPRATGNLRVQLGRDGNAMEVEEKERSTHTRSEEEKNMRECPLRVPVIPKSVAQGMKSGTTAIAFDESVGRMCVAMTGDTGVHVLDFGGESWEPVVVQV